MPRHGAQGRPSHGAALLHVDFHTCAYLWARRRALCPKRLWDVQLCGLLGPRGGSWRAVSVKPASVLRSG